MTFCILLLLHSNRTFLSSCFVLNDVFLCVGEVDYKEIGDCVHVSGHSSTDLCLPALDYLRKCSQVGTPVYTQTGKQQKCQ